MVKKIYISYDDITKYIEDVVKYFESINVKPNGVYGIPRGGLFFAILLSYRMDIPLLLAPCDGCVVIDDIADTGRTLAHYTENETQFNKYYLTTMFYNSKECSVKVDFYEREKAGDWVVFPYEGDSGDALKYDEAIKNKK